MRKKLMFLIPVIIVVIAVVLVLIIVNNSKPLPTETEDNSVSEMAVSEDTLPTITVSNPDVLTIEGRRKLYGQQEIPENKLPKFEEETHKHEAPVVDIYEFGEGVSAPSYVVDSVPSIEEITKVADWCKSRNIEGSLYYFPNSAVIKEDYDSSIDLERCYTCTVNESYDYIIYIDENGEPQQYYYEQ